MFLWLLTVVFVLPVLLAVLLSGAFRSTRLQPALRKVGWSRVQRTPQAWDWFFITQHHQGCWVIAEMKDGRRIGGEYGASSFASLSPNSNDLFLEAEYLIGDDMSFGEKIADNVGVWLNGAEIRALHFYRVTQGAAA